MSESVPSCTHQRSASFFTYLLYVIECVSSGKQSILFKKSTGFPIEHVEEISFYSTTFPKHCRSDFEDSNIYKMAVKVKNAWTLIKCFKIYQKHFIGVKYSFIMIFEKFKIILLFIDWVFIFYRKDCCLQNQRTVSLHGRKTMFLLKKLIASYYIILDNLLTIQ